MPGLQGSRISATRECLSDGVNLTFAFKEQALNVDSCLGYSTSPKPIQLYYQPTHLSVTFSADISLVSF